MVEDTLDASQPWMVRVRMEPRMRPRRARLNRQRLKIEAIVDEARRDCFSRSHLW